MMLRPALRLLTGPFPPFRLAARFFAAVILPPRLFFIGVSFGRIMAEERTGDLFSFAHIADRPAGLHNPVL
jgi:hypothetical protein